MLMEVLRDGKATFGGDSPCETEKVIGFRVLRVCVALLVPARGAYRFERGDACSNGSRPMQGYY